MSSRGDVTRLLADLNAGKKEAEEKLLLLVYEELHDLAKRYMRHERQGHTLQTTALIHEAYIHLGGGMDNLDSDVTVTSCIFTGNIACEGGGIFNMGGGNLTVTGCIFTGNIATTGGGMVNLSSNSVVTNCAFTGNSGTGGGFTTSTASPR